MATRSRPSSSREPAAPHAAPEARGWLRLAIPAPWNTLGRWRVRVGRVEGGPGELLGSEPGVRAVHVEAAFAAPGFQAAGSIDLEVEVISGGVSEIELPLALLPGAAPPPAATD